MKVAGHTISCRLSQLVCLYYLDLGQEISQKKRRNSLFIKKLY